MKVFVSSQIFHDLCEFRKLKRIKLKTEKNKTNVYIKSSELYNNFLEIYYLFSRNLFSRNPNDDPERLPLKEELTDKEEQTDEEEYVDLSHMQPLEGDEEVKEGKGLKT